MVKNTVIVDVQAGDSGKARMVDYLMPKHDIAVRFNGGMNAGHTIWYNGKKYVTHGVPSGILYPDKLNIIGPGTVIDPIALVKEITEYQQAGLNITPDTLVISNRAHIVTPQHLADDQSNVKRIGSTGRGIGPAYVSKVDRQGLRFHDLTNSSIQGIPDYVRDFLTPYVKDSVTLLNNLLKSGKNAIFEGAQGTLLDVDHGTYPFVTSSNCVAGYASVGAGVGPNQLHEIVGVAKAYTTKVGNGPFATETLADAERLRSLGGEYGATTGRPRRCGWLDLPALKYAVMINGVTQLAITKLDILSHFDTIPVGVGYKDEVLNYGQESVYTTMDGWNKDISNCRNISDLPFEARSYIDMIEDYTGIRVKYIGVGQDRNQIIVT